ncbi:MAG: CHRD domain-containing protein [Pseudomonadales bacterium]
MKTRKQSKLSWATVILMAAVVGFLGGCSSDDDDPDEGTDSSTTDGGSTDSGGTDGGSTDGGGTDGGAIADLVFSLSPAEQVPPVTADGATGEANLSFDPSNNGLSGSVSASGLSGDASAAHIHQGFAGMSGGVVVGLEAGATANVFNVPADTILTADQTTALLRGEMYVNVHTVANADGEVRGQIVPAGVSVIRTSLSGDQEVPPVSTSATGEGVVTLHESSYGIWATVIVSGLDEATAAHIHQAAAGENGSVWY